ncbi:carbonic anhydrase 4-like [Ctenopharyngodon idella]|uniref:carbonic anhydrase 4-like n=1 Tax=Ctenopharyngodon idella TaxID=7959 RepID=UPI0022311C23|nr:carbonic anhydrase 4-like [Ctenopharyngodon idella]
MIVLLVTCLAALLSPSVHGVDFTTWPTIAPQFCNGFKQSPINIVTVSVQGNPNLTTFNFTGFDDNSTFLEIVNSGVSVVVSLNSSKMAVQGGDLPGLYNPTQVSIHWGNGSSSPGSEHTVDGKQYPMELQILNVHSKYNGNVSAALAANDSIGLAVFSFFIEVNNKFPMKIQVTLNSLLEGVDKTKYYRYQGSLTTPNCNEVVIWTVFKQPINVSQNLINLFSTTLNFKADGASVLMN